jgi:tellurite resistance protein TerC
VPLADLPLAASSAANALDIDVSAAMWAGLAVVVIGMLAIDLLLFARHRAPSMRASVIWSLAWVALAVAFGAGWWWWQGGEAGSQYFAGYLLERSLSLDNVFVFTVILGYFAVPAPVQPKVLSWAIGLALAFRLAFILVGAALIASFTVTFYVFGALLLYTAYKLARHGDVADIEPERNPALRALRRALPMTESYRGERFIISRAGRPMATPLLAVFVVVATTDLIFAVDSIPAIFAVTQEAFVVFAANAFAMLGLRALYFLLAGMADRFAYLSQGLAVILAFIGVKMLLIDLWHVPVWLSLCVIAGVLALSVLLSLRTTASSRLGA